MNSISPNIFPKPKHIIVDSVSFLDVSELSEINIPERMNGRIHLSIFHYCYQESLSPQAFQLIIDKAGISIYFNDEVGVLYCHQVLRELLQQYSKKLPYLTLKDKPNFEKRGIILDISRDKIPTLDTVKSLIDFWSKLRINQLQLYTEHAFAYQKHEVVWKDYDVMTGQDIVEIDRYCMEKGIELIPNQATFGHMEKWLCHPEYQHLAEQTGGFWDQRGDYRPESFGLNPIDPEVLTFIESLLDEVLPHFSSRTLNINFDETLDLGIERSKDECEKNGKGQVYLNYLLKLIDVIDRKSFSPQIFSDMLFYYPEILPKLPANLELLNWGYEEDHPFDEEHAQLASFGYPFQVVVSTNTFASVAGRDQACRVHMERAAVSAYKYGAKGYQITEWGDMGHAQQFSMSLPGYLFGSGMAWGHEENKYLDTQFLLSKYWGEEYQTLYPYLSQIQNHYLDSGVITPNCAFYGPFLFDQKSRRHIKRAVIDSETQLYASLDALIALQKKLRTEDDSFLKTEISWTIYAMILATQIAIGYRKYECREVENFPIEFKQELQLQLDEVLSKYSSLWMDKYREGGCKQSMARLFYLKELLTAYVNTP